MAQKLPFGPLQQVVEVSRYLTKSTILAQLSPIPAKLGKKVAKRVLDTLAQLATQVCGQEVVLETCVLATFGKMYLVQKVRPYSLSSLAQDATVG